MFESLANAPLDDSVVAVNHVIRSLEYGQAISDTKESGGTDAGNAQLSSDESAVVRSIVDEIRQIEGLPLNYLSDETRSKYSVLLAEIVQRSVEVNLSRHDTQRAHDFLRKWQQDDPEIQIVNTSEDSALLTFFLIGAGIGAALGLLFAPKAGAELRSDIAEATRKGFDRSREVAQQLGAKAIEVYDTTRARAGELYDSARETAGEYYEATHARSSELYDTATARAGEVVSVRDATARQAESIQAAVEAGKKAYIEQKRKTEFSGRTEAAPSYKPERVI